MEVCEDKLEQEIAFYVEKEEYGDIKMEQKTDPVIQIGTVNKKKTRTHDELKDIVQLGPSFKVNPKSWFGPKRNTKVTFNTTTTTHHPPTQTFGALPGKLMSRFGGLISETSFIFD